MIDMGEMVRGRTVAVVGRAPILEGDADRIDAHDVVYRVANTPTGGSWGSRTDIVFLNWQDARDIYQRRSRALLERLSPIPLWVYKGRPSDTRRDGAWRVARWPNIKNPNAVTLMLWDLIRYHEPASVTVFATDLYASGPGHAYTSDVDPRPLDGQATGIIKHRPYEQLKVHRALASTGIIVGDDRYLAAATLTDDQYRPIVEAWDHVYRSGLATI